jgi:hypothetical protein
LSVPIGPRSRPRPRGERDETTRYLCAAAHLDTAFADRAIAEYLVEPVRAVPPSPGIDAASVLREAIAARARRRSRDLALLGLLGVFCLVKFSWVVLWTLVAVAVTVLLPSRFGGPHRRSAPIVAVGVAAAVVALGSVGPTLGLGLLTMLYAPTPYYSASATDTTLALVALLVGSAVVAVVGLDEFTVHHLVNTCFRRHQFHPDAAELPDGWEKKARTMGHGWKFGNELRRVGEADAQTDDSRYADVIVHRSFVPFVGAGVLLSRHLIAMPLEPDEESSLTANAKSIDVVGLHAHVADALAELRNESSLGPGRRLEQLIRREQVFVPAERLARNLDAQTNPPVLPDPRRPPISQMDVASARRIADQPPEWARYYQCFRVEAWDRDLTTSCYLHAGTDQRMLFLEWTFYALPPIRAAYRDIDRVSDPVLAPLGSTLLRLVTLPATVPARIRSLLHRFRRIEQRDHEIVAERYGAGQSLREMAAADGVQTYFQDVDIERYRGILDKALVRAVGQYLHDNGYSVVEFQRQAIAQFFDMRGSTNNGNTFGPNSPVKDNVFGPSAT